MECDMCHQTGVPLKTCSACKTAKYCSAACQTAAWVEHRAACNRARKERESSKAKEEEGANAPGSGSSGSSGSGSGSGRSSSGLQDMGSNIDALKQQQQHQQHIDILNACYHDSHEELQKLLLRRSVDIDWTEPDIGTTAAIIAAQQGSDKCLALLISKGANLLKVNKYGATPIHMACQTGRHTTLALLLDNGVDASLPSADEYGDTPATISCSMGHVKLLALLLDRGSDPNQANKTGATAAHLACANGYVKCIQLLIKRGANINIRDRSGNTPLDLARIYKHLECEDLLLSNDAVGRDIADIHVLDEATKETVANHVKEAKAYQKGARRCDNPACQTSPDDNSNKRPKKCAACEVALYCCAACQTAHWPAHAMLCQELR